MEEKSTVKILVVEDEHVIREICRRVLTAEGYQVSIAENGKLAKEMIYKDDYSLFLIDLRTPVIDGQELYVWMLQEKPELVNRVIFTTGDLMGTQALRFITQTKKAFLPKPFNGEGLKSIVRTTLEGLENKNTGE